MNQGSRIMYFCANFGEKKSKLSLASLVSKTTIPEKKVTKQKYFFFYSLNLTISTLKKENNFFENRPTFSDKLKEEALLIKSLNFKDKSDHKI